MEVHHRLLEQYQDFRRFLSDLEHQTRARMTHLLHPMVLLIFAFAIGLPTLGAAQDSSSFMRNTNLFGRDYHNFEMSNPDVGIGARVCMDECRKDRNCRAWTYVKRGIQGPMARCWMKHSVPRATPNQCCISGVVTIFDEGPELHPVD
jgi:hypothetical protein